MRPIFGDFRSRTGNFRDLMTAGVRVIAYKRVTTGSTTDRAQFDDRGNSFGGLERRPRSVMTGLCASCARAARLVAVAAGAVGRKKAAWKSCVSAG